MSLEKEDTREAEKRSVSSDPSCVSVESYQFMPIELNGGGLSSDESFLRKRSDSPVLSVLSMKSDKSMTMPIHLKQGSQFYQSSCETLDSSVPSILSIKSGRSIDMPILFKNGESLFDKSAGERSDSSVPSMLSLRSDRSMDMPILLKRDESLDQSSNQKKDSTAPKALVIKHVYSRSTETNRSNQRHDPPSFLEILQRFKSQMKMKHQCVFEGLYKQEIPTLLNEIYTELYITESESGGISNKHELRQIETQSRRTATEDTPIKCNDIFKALPAQDKPIRSVLTKGVAGIGKTVSVQKFILDWAEGKENQDVHLIFPLPFREINLMKNQTLSLLDLLHLFFPETKELEISSGEYKVLFIFDGLDECRVSLDFHSSVRLCDVSESASVDVILTNLMKGNLLPSALIWITSRPAAADLIPSECVDRVTEVRGFTDKQKEEYFSKRISDESLNNRIISHLKSSRSLYIMCHIPVFCWISATVLERMLSEAESEGEIPKTLTQMYTHFLIIQTNIKHQKDYEKKVKNDEDMIFKLGKLAFEQLVKGNLIFYDEDLRECGIDVAEASVYSGLCTQIFREEFGLYLGKVYSFLHLSVQEHLAALYLHLEFTKNNRNVLDQQKSHISEIPLTMFSLHKCAIDKALKNTEGHLDLLLRFLMGFSMDSNHILLEGLLVKRPHSFQEQGKTIEYLTEKIRGAFCPHQCVNLFHCLRELNDHSLTNKIQRILNSGEIDRQCITTELWSALLYVLMMSDEKFDEFDLRKYGGSEEILRWLHPVVKLSTKAQLQDCNITLKGCAFLCLVLTSSSNVRQLDLSKNNNLQDSGVEMLCVGVTKLHSTPSLKTMFLTGNDWNIEEILNNCAEYFKSSAGLQDTECGLESLKLKDCGVTEEGCYQLSKALSLNPSHLRELDLSGNYVGSSGVKHLCAVLEKTECALQILKLNKCGITEESCAALASALSSKMSTLIELDLSVNALQDSGVKLISAGLKNPHCKLKILRLSNCSVTKEGVAALAEALKSNPSHMTKLDLWDNRLKESDENLLSMILDKVIK
ncbi:NLR family CARD domain-containing protein 3-like [Triplophysa dalaica]|uniref:NLR family CARD domain-containing protein 3-like n=1 Tax=Triplophysa dalaica TaxID=1582913 RepID=UPI0024DF318D|nr:NLR family CARD domain-containing protein 3-like [Triplophysa dalaica]XP_056612735.1 NLR family CARD domain-containing protein 3-like [Triplophysa dalaica]